MRYIITLICSLLLISCAQVPLNKATTSGKPERIFNSVKVSEIRSKIIERCSMSGLQVEERGTNTIVCSKTLTGGDAVMAQMLIGNSYSTTPEHKVSFLITQRNNDVFVMTNNIWIQTQMALGQIKTQELNNNKQYNDIQAFLDGL